MNIIFIRSNPVDPDSRVEKEINSLLKQNHLIKILAWDRSEDYKVKKNVLFLENGNVDIFRFGIPATFGGGMKKNLLPLLKFQLNVFQWLNNNKDSFDAIHACDFDTAFISSKIAFKYEKKFVYDIFDYYVDAFNVPKKIKKMIEKKDKEIINNSDAVIICTEKRKEQIGDVNQKNIHVIHNSPPMYINDKVGRFNLNKEKIKIVYVGILDDGRLIKETAEIVKNNIDYEYHVAGFGRLAPLLEEMSQKYKNIFFYGKIPYIQTLELEKNCDIMTALYDPAVPNHNYAAPNKFYEALMLGKPLIMAKNTGMNEVIEKYKIGVVIEYGEKSLEEGINRLVELKDEWPKISCNMKNIYRDNYSWNEMENRLLKIYSETE